MVAMASAKGKERGPGHASFPGPHPLPGIHQFKVQSQARLRLPLTQLPGERSSSLSPVTGT